MMCKGYLEADMEEQLVLLYSLASKFHHLGVLKCTCVCVWKKIGLGGDLEMPRTRAHAPSFP